jgi:CheY-like chemotaxis protein
MPGRVLLADDSPHAQRMGERILREEGYEVVTVTDGETALLRLEDADPDVLLIDVFLPLKSGYEICRKVKADPRFQHAGVVLIAGLLEPVDEEEARNAGSDAVLKKPFEASVVLGTLRPLMERARAARGLSPEVASSSYEEEPPFYDADDELPPLDEDAAEEVDLHARIGAKAAPTLAMPPSFSAIVSAGAKAGLGAAIAPAHAPHADRTKPLEIDEERVRAAVTLAMDRALPALINEITEKVLIALGY